MLSLLQHQQIQSTPNVLQQKQIPKQFQSHIDKMRQQNVPGVQLASKKIRKPKEQWQSSYKLLEIGVPTQVQNEKFKKRYQIKVKFQDNNNKVRSKTVLFGKKGKIEYTDDGQEQTKTKNQNNSKKDKTFFDANFWRMNLLNDTKDIKTNYINCVNKYI